MPRWAEVPLVDGSYSDDAKPWSVQECINYIPVAAEQATTMSAAILRQLPGATLYVNLASEGVDPGPIRGMHNVEGQLFVVAGTTLFELRTTGAVFNRGTIPGTERVRMAHNQITNGFQLAIPTGSSGYVWDTTTQTLTHITDDGFTGAITFDFIDNYITYVDAARNFAGTSELADALSYNTLDRYDAEASPDKIVGQIVSHQQWWLMSTRTIEPYNDTGQNTGTFQRAEGMVIDQGLASPWAVVNLDNTVIWLGANGFVYRANGYTPVRISTHAIEQAIARCNISRAFAFTWEDRGHSVFYLTFPDGYTLGYDCASGKWHRRESYGLQRWRMNDLVAWNGGYYGGDFASGKVYLIDWDASDEDGQIMERRRTTGVLYDSRNPVIVKALEIVIDTGLPRPIFPLTIMGDMGDGIISTPMGIQYVHQGGIGAVTYTYTGTLPTGITLSVDGLASGVFSGPGVFNFTVIATDSMGSQATIPQSVTVGPIVVTGALGNARSGFSSSVQYQHVGGIEPVTFSVSAGALPPALVLTSSGLLSGVRSTQGVFNFTIRATDAVGNFTDHPDTSTTSAPWNWSFIAQTALPRQAARLAPAYADSVTNLVIATDDSSGGAFVSSDGGHTWAAKATGFNVLSQAFCAGASKGALVVFSANGGGVKRSIDGGNTWSTIALLPVENAIYSPDAIFIYGTSQVKYSIDGGSTYTNCAVVPPGMNVGDSNIAFGGLYIPQWNTWIAPGQNTIYESVGLAPSIWTQVASGLGRVGIAAYSPTLDIAVINSNSGMYYRTQAGSWTLSVTPSISNGVCWVPSINLFLAYASGTSLYSSADGINWIPHTSSGLTNAGYMIWSPVANEILVTPSNVAPFIPYVSDI